MKNVVIEHLVEKSREGTYYAIPFTVPEGAASLTVSYSYPRLSGAKGSPVNVIDLGLEDGEGRFLGWSGSSRASVKVGEYDSTPGYLMEPVRAGEWHILTGAYRVAPGGVPVRYEISFGEAGPRWLFGDLHVHSDASDGRFSIPELAAMAKARGLDFLAVTNHNNYSENFSLPRIPGLTLIPGVEWTHYRGHMNFLGIKKPFSGSFIANDEEQMRRITRQARENGALVSVNHPKCGLCPYLWEDRGGFQAVEIWNGPMRAVNLRGIEWWTSLLRSGRRLTALGGSDFHRPFDVFRLGRPVTAVLADDPSGAGILRALERGRCYVTGGMKGPRLEMSCGEATFGDSAEGGGGRHVLSVRARKMPPGSKLQVIGENGVIASAEPKGGNISCETEVSGTSFAYLKAVRGMPLAVSNPIYFTAEPGPRDAEDSGASGGEPR